MKNMPGFRFEAHFWEFLLIMMFALFAAHASGQLPGDSRETLTQGEPGMRDALFTIVSEAVHASETLGLSSAVEKLQERVNLDAAETELFVVYSLSVMEGLDAFRAQSYLSHVCARQQEVRTGRDYGRALDELASMTADHVTELLDGLGRQLSDEGFRELVRSGLYRRSVMTRSDTSAGVEDFYADKSDEEVQEIIGVWCDQYGYSSERR